jgi:preprotein translocase SecE subunit
MSISSYLKETKAELKEVRFPTISQTVTFTVLVVVLSAIIAFVLGGADFGLKTLLAKILTQ